MSGYPGQQAYDGVSGSSHTTVLQGAKGRLLTRYVLRAVILFLIGIQFAGGRHLATWRTFNCANGIGLGFIFMLVGTVAVIAANLMRVHIRSMSGGVAPALGFILAEAAFPIGALAGCISNSTLGSFPHETGFGSTASVTAGFDATR